MRRKCLAIVLTVAVSALFVAMAAVSVQTAIAWKDSRDFYRAHATTCWANP